MSASTLIMILLALAAGIMLPTQAAVNNKMSIAVQSPITGAFISFTIGTLALFIYAAVTGSIATVFSARNAPAIAWTGGLMGAFFVTITIILITRLGVAMTFSLVVAGQMLATLVIDHFGFLGVDVKPITAARLAGVALVIIGVILVRKF